jgi:hypothetical protein
MFDTPGTDAADPSMLCQETPPDALIGCSPTIDEINACSRSQDVSTKEREKTYLLRSFDEFEYCSKETDASRVFVVMFFESLV